MGSDCRGTSSTTAAAHADDEPSLGEPDTNGASLRLRGRCQTRTSSPANAS